MRFGFMMSILNLLMMLLPGTGHAGGATTVGPGNPAAIFCESHGRSVFIREGNDSTYICQLGVARVSQWTLYRHLELGRPQLALSIFSAWPDGEKFSGDGAAENYCSHVGGRITFATDQDSRPVPNCEFADGSSMEAATLLRGPSATSNRELKALLQK